jgi:hypothetical protein
MRSAEHGTFILFIVGLVALIAAALLIVFAIVPDDKADAATGCHLTSHGSYAVSYRCMSGKYRTHIWYRCNGQPVLKNGPWRYDWDPASIASVPLGCGQITAYGLQHG